MNHRKLRYGCPEPSSQNSNKTGLPNISNSEKSPAFSELHSHNYTERQTIRNSPDLPASPLCPGESEAPPSMQGSRMAPANSHYNKSAKSTPHSTPSSSHNHISGGDVIDGAILVVNVVNVVRTTIHVVGCVVGAVASVAGALG